MDTYKLEKDVKVFGMQVKTFPEGIAEAFDSLAKKILNGYQRPYYGISYFNTDGTIFYIAAAKEEQEGEAEKYEYERYIIRKGKYYTTTIKDWRKKTGCIKDVFYEMMQDNRIDKAGPCIEWYKTDDEMMCMMKTTESE